MKLYTFELPQSIHPCDAFAPLAALPYSLFLDSADHAHTDSNYSFIVSHPLETIEAKDDTVTITNRNQQTSFAADPFEMVESRLKSWGLAKDVIPGLPPFQGGAAGFFGYDLARVIETLPAREEEKTDRPDMAIGIYDQVLAFDHAQNKAWIFTHAKDEDEAEKKRNHLLSVIKTVHATKEHSISPAWSVDFTAEAYKVCVQRVIDFIHEGDIFQTNLAQRFTANLPGGFDAFAHYKTLRTMNAAPFAGFMNLGNIRISSASPERFLSVKDGWVQSKPIKGTIKRLDGQDEQQRKQLQSSEKDRAENIMIVDLLRNDLSKVCEPASIAVEKLCDVETFARVHHLVSSITGTLKRGQSALQLLRACFPGGSITGAPKIRAMEIIDTLEPVRRGPYCGAMGYAGANGAMDMNILIRTLVYEGNKVSFHAGGGVTADSSPEAEYQETLDKAAAIFASFEGDKMQRKTG